jgi:multicomponent Na+:H+ antiporter subunit D
MPWTMAAFAIASLSMIGIPPAAGFVSKWYILLGAVEAQVWFAVAVIVVSTLLNAAYFLPIVYDAFLRSPAGDGRHAQHGEAPLPMVLALLVTAGATIALFFLSDLPIALGRAIVVEVP